MNRTSPSKYKILSERNNNIFNEYWRLRVKKQLSPDHALKAIWELGIFKSITGKHLTIKTLKGIIENKRYLKHDKE